MKTYKFVLIAAALMCGSFSAVWAQNDSTRLARKKAIANRLAWHGFVNPHFFLDTRQNVTGKEEMMLFYPKPVVPDADGKDLNATPSMNLMSVTTRLNLTIDGPELLNAKMKGFIEGDFTSSLSADINSLRLRHAYLSMQWQSSSLLMGQYWHPMVLHEIMPMTNPLNTGAPFHPYARYNQLRYSQLLGNVELLAVAAFQLDSKSQGPDENYPYGVSNTGTKFSTRSLVPELNVQVRYRSERLFVGAAANLLTLQPRSYVLDTNGGTHKTTQRFSLPSFSLFGMYRFDNWTLKAQALLNDNLYESNTLGGYIERAHLNGDCWTYDYESWSFTTLWLDLSRTQGKWRPGLFLGFAGNNWANDDTRQPIGSYDRAFGRAFNIDCLYRIQPRLVYHTQGNLFFQAEVEYTAAHYLQGDGTPGSTEHWADNCRFSLGATYNF